MSTRTIVIYGRGYNTTQAEIAVVINGAAVYNGPVWTSSSSDGQLFTFDVVVDDLNESQTQAITNDNWSTTMVKTQDIAIMPTVGDLFVGAVQSPPLAQNDAVFVYDPPTFIWTPPSPATTEDPTYSPTLNNVPITINRTPGAEGEWHYTVPQSSTLKFKIDVANMLTFPA